MIERIKNALSEIKWIIVGIGGKIIIDLLFWTTRIESIGLEKVKHLIDSREAIFAFWHSRILLISYIYKGYNGAIMVSPSRDGEIIARIVQRQGHTTIRGSSFKTPRKALLRLIKTMKDEKKPGVVIPDGPRGPRYKAQPGIVKLAKMTGYPIIPASYTAKKMAVFSSWDRFILPYPFTTCKVVYGDPVYVPTTADKEEEKTLLMEFETSLNRITKDVDSYFNHSID